MLVTRLVLVFALTTQLLQWPAFGARTTMDLSLQQRMDVFSLAPTWGFITHLIRMTRSKEDVEFFMGRLKAAGLQENDRIEFKFANDTLTIPKHKFSMQFLKDGKSIKVGSAVLSLNANESLEANFKRFEKALGGSRSASAFSALISPAHADTLTLLGGTFALMGLVAAGTPPLWVGIAFVLILGVNAAMGGELAKVKDFSCDENRFEIKMTNGKVQKISDAHIAELAKKLGVGFGEFCAYVLERKSEVLAKFKSGDLQMGKASTAE